MHALTRSEFSQLFFGDVGQENFFAKYWQKAPCVLKDPTGSRLQMLFGEMPPEDRVRMWLMRAQTQANEHKFLLLNEANDPGAERRRMAAVEVTPAQALSAFEERFPSFLTAFYLESLDRELMRYRTRIVEALGMTDGGNSYLCGYIHGNKGAGADLHFDEYPLFQINLQGERMWEVSAKPADIWNRSSYYTGNDGWLRFTNSNGQEVSIDPKTEPLQTIRLEPGDILYLPACTPHRTHSLGARSIAVSIFVEGARPDRLLSELLKSAKSPISWRIPVPNLEIEPRAVPGAPVVGTETVAQLRDTLTSWYETVVKSDALLWDAIADQLPKRTPLAPCVPRPRPSQLTPQSLLSTSVECPVHVLKRHANGRVAQLRIDSHTLEFGAGPESALGAFLVEGGVIPARDLIAAMQPDVKAEDTLENLQALLEIQVLEIIGEAEDE